MTTLREAAQQALEALDPEHPDIQLRAAAALRDALEQQEQEPVAYTGDVARRMREAVLQQMTRFHDLVCAEASLRAAAAFAIPHRREWQSLSEEEIDRWTPEIHPVIRAVEAALKEKNNG
jgi:hypothetical protein